MKTIHGLAALTMLATGCNLFALDPAATLTITAGGRDHQVQWPPRESTFVTARQRLDDPEGLGGLEIIVDGDDIARRTYSASYLASAGKPHFEVPDRGYVNITVRITQGGRSVAEISERWALEPKVRWEVDIDRAPYSQSNGITDDLENPECQWFWCHRVWRSPIAEGAAHYPDEALWVAVYRVHPDECADVC